MTPDPHAEVLRGGAGSAPRRPVSSIPTVLHPEVGSDRCCCVLGPRAAEEGGSPTRLCPWGRSPQPRSPVPAGMVPRPCSPVPAGTVPPAAGCPQGSAGSQVPGSVDLDVSSPEAVARMAADRPAQKLLSPRPPPPRPDGPKQRPGSREGPRPRPPGCCCHPPVRIWELARVTAPGTVDPATAAGLLGLLGLSQRCCPTSEKGPEVLRSCQSYAIRIARGIKML
ncbi:unnamed protein product [Nyctereutes procyonoides]|uniref:(raccoon dog) hypothetical protein n=1 Tax=Nyctereutes procyonoides TaxID=34880 RepID=A0A811YQ49_NYCPR|nr:unnamed protein product [Nyctereutes procyonoides]